MKTQTTKTVKKENEMALVVRKCMDYGLVLRIRMH